MKITLSFIGGVIFSTLLATAAAAQPALDGGHLDSPIVHLQAPIAPGATLRGNAAKGISDGTGYRGPGTATGGPVGGLPNRN